MYLGVTGGTFQTITVFRSLKTIFVFTNSAATDDISHNASFHQSLHCFTQYAYRCPFLGGGFVVVDYLLIVTHIMGLCNCSMF